jgi:hypothetical protein
MEVTVANQEIANQLNVLSDAIEIDEIEQRISVIESGQVATYRITPVGADYCLGDDPVIDLEIMAQARRIGQRRVFRMDLLA